MPNFRDYLTSLPFKLPSFPECLTQLPTLPAVPMPSMPNLSMPSMPNLSMSSMPNLSMPSMPNLSMPSMPNLSIPNISASASLGLGLVNGVTAIAPTVVGWVGFTSTGVTAGSYAAVWQSSIGNVIAGSTFASLQAYGATAATATVGSVAVGVVLPISTAYGVYYLAQNSPQHTCNCEILTQNDDNQHRSELDSQRPEPIDYNNRFTADFKKFE